MACSLIDLLSCDSFWSNRPVTICSIGRLPSWDRYVATFFLGLTGYPLDLFERWNELTMFFFFLVSCMIAFNFFASLSPL